MNDDDRKMLATSRPGMKLFRAAEQQAAALKPKLTPDQWAKLLSALAAFGMQLMEIFIGPRTQTRESESPAGRPAGDGEGDDDQGDDDARG